MPLFNTNPNRQREIAMSVHLSSSSSQTQPQPQPPADETLSLTLIPGLPNDVAALILAFVPYSHLGRLKSTCRSWRSFLSSKALISLRHGRRRGALSSLLCFFPQDPAVASPYLFDAAGPAWLPLPPAPCDPNLYGLCNFAAVAVGPRLFLLGGSVFDARSFPLDRPAAAAAALRFDFAAWRWAPLAPMLSPRGSFACAAAAAAEGPDLSIFVAGGGSRHALFGAAGSRISSAERYDAARDEWVPMEGLPSFRAGCVGFFVGGIEGREREFWVMGGYGESRTISGVFPVDEHYRNVVAMGVETGKWREVGEMWGPGERPRLGKIVAVEEEDDGGVPRVFMLDGSDILRYDIATNRWWEETRVPREAPLNSSFGFVASDGELHIVTNLKKAIELPTDILRSRQLKKTGKLYIQIYNPKRKTWRSLVTKSPFNNSLDFNTAVLCNIRL